MRRGSLGEVCAVDLYFFFLVVYPVWKVACLSYGGCVIEAEASEPIWSKSTKQSAYLGPPNFQETRKTQNKKGISIPSLSVTHPVHPTLPVITHYYLYPQPGFPVSKYRVIDQCCSTMPECSFPREAFKMVLDVGGLGMMRGRGAVVLLELEQLEAGKSSEDGPALS